MQLWSTGPALIYAGPMLATPGQAVFAGTCDDKPSMDIEFIEKDVGADDGGDAALDRMYLGKRATIALDFAKFNYPVVQALCNRPNIAGALLFNQTNVGGAGADDPGDVGTLMATENNAFTLFVLFPYAAKPAYGALAAGNQGFAGMVSGYRFPFCSSSRENVLAGTQQHKKRLVFHAIRARNPAVTATNAYGSGQLLLYDFPPGLTAFPPPI